MEDTTNTSTDQLSCSSACPTRKGGQLNHLKRALRKHPTDHRSILIVICHHWLGSLLRLELRSELSPSVLYSPLIGLIESIKEAVNDLYS
jgi:hypothetical protein